MSTTNTSTTIDLSRVSIEETTNQWVSRPAPESVSEAMNETPMGFQNEIVYSVLTGRLKALLQSQDLLIKGFVPTAVNFRVFNNTLGTDAKKSTYRSGLWNQSPDERIPVHAPLASPVTGEANKGLIIAKLFTDMKQHVPLVLFNITGENYVPTGVGGSSISRRFYKDGKSVNELVYRSTISAEVLCVTGDEQSTASLQAIVKTCFGTLRDFIGEGASIEGKAWQLVMPTNIAPSTISEIDAPWASGDDKGAKLYTASVSLENITFECVSYVAVPSGIPDGDLTSSESGLAITFTGDTDKTQPITMKLGEQLRVFLSEHPISYEMSVSQAKRVVSFNRSGGNYTIKAVRLGTAKLLVFDTGLIPALDGSTPPGAKFEAAQISRDIIVISS